MGYAALSGAGVRQSADGGIVAVEVVLPTIPAVDIDCMDKSIYSRSRATRAQSNNALGICRPDLER